MAPTIGAETGAEKKRHLEDRLLGIFGERIILEGDLATGRAIWSVWVLLNQPPFPLSY